MLCIKILILLTLNTEQLIHQSDIVYPRTAIAIYKLETGNGKSSLYRNHYNMWGFKSNGKYKRYGSKIEALNDYIRYEKRMIEKHNIKNRDHYINTISKTYASNPDWKRLIKQMI